MSSVEALKKEDVQAVIDRINRFGWAQGFKGNSNQPVCVLEHANHVLSISAFDMLKQALMGIIPIPDKKKLGDVYTVIEWNDTPGRTKEEVIAVLEKAKDACTI